MYFDDFLGRLKKGDESHLVLLFGDSEGVISEGFQIFKEKFRKIRPEGTVQVFEGNEKALGEVLSAAQTSSLFSTAQLLVVKHAEKVLGGRSEESVKHLKDYFANPNPDSYLILLAPGMRKTAKAVAAVERLGWAVQCSDMPEWKIISWLRQQTQAKDISLSEEGAQFLVQKIGMDAAYLQQALEQLALYVYPRKSASLEEIKELPAPGLESEIFPFLDAVGSRQTDKALRLITQLEDGLDVGTTFMVYSRVRELLLIAIGRAKGWNQVLLGEKLSLNPFRLKTLWEQAGQFSVPELKAALLDLIHLQAGVVTGRLGKSVPAVVLEWWVLKWGKNRMAVKNGATR